MFCNPTLFLPIFHRMQSFFVASTHFSVQNRRMQEEKPKQKKSFIKRIGIFNLICITAFIGSLLVAAAAVAYMYRNVPTHKNGEHSLKLPWVGHEMVVSDIHCAWMDVSSNSWMKMNGITKTPFIKLTLGDCVGSGTMYIQFRNDNGQYVGNPVTLVYRNGQFDNIDRQYYKTAGKQAVVYGFPVFTGTNLISQDDQFLAHCLNTRKKPWQVEVSYYPQTLTDTGRQMLGYSTVSKELHQENQQ